LRHGVGSGDHRSDCDRRLETVARVRAQFSNLAPKRLIVPEILPGSLGPRASAIGASLLPIYSMFGPDKGVLMKRAREKKPLMVGSIF
jgi:hypothetical protein